MNTLPKITEIRMQSNAVECYLCAVETEYGWSVPTYNGDVVSNDFPDDMWSKGGGAQPVCQRCYDMHANGQATCYDRLYLPRGLSFINGGGI